mmetsp:Transcript_2637/g.4098  ORF Transcript_2637/g.4098 Transcript_2637/m.4098 type:complete len:185 (+) Transcript_2637:588-1142(+)
MNLNRSDTTFRNMPIRCFYRVVRNYENYVKEFDKKNMIKEFRFVERDPKHSVVYVRSKAGALASDRENLIESFIYKMEGEFAGRYLIIGKSVERDDVPVAKGCIRMEQYKATMLWNDDAGDMHMTEFSSFDLKGYFPKALLNMVMSSMAQQSVTQFGNKMKEIKAEIEKEVAEGKELEAIEWDL